MTTLPPFQPTYGHGQQAALQPGLVAGAKVYNFMVKIDPQKAEDFVNQRLAGPTLGELEYKVLGEMALISYLDADKLSSTAQTVGWVGDHECAMTLLLAEKRKGSDDVRLVAWMPYIFVDTSIAMATGREIWGFPKEMSQLTLPAKDGDPAFFSATARVFKTFSPTTEGVVEPIVTVKKDGSVGPLQAIWDDLEQLTEWFIDAITNDDNVLWHWDDYAELALDAANMLIHRQVQVVNLKQFRDAEFGDRACFQSVVNGPFKIETVRGGGLLVGDYTLEVNDVASHQIINDLGLAGDSVDVIVGFWVDMDFRVEPGKTIWSAF